MSPYGVAGSGSLLGFLICLSAILITGNAISFVAALFGAGTLVAVFAIRKWRLGLLGRAGTVALAAITIIGVFSIVPAGKETDPTLALPTRDQISSIQRMLSDAKWTGSGAGSLEALWPFYRESAEVDSLEIPTTASAIAIEMGRPFLWTSILVLLIGAWMLFTRALLRRRDYVYPAAGAACIIGLFISSFANDGHLALTASLAISVVCGLALAQSQSSTNRDPGGFDELYSIANKTNSQPRQTLPQKSFTPTQKWLRVAVGLFGLFLAAQAVWILLPERYRPNHIRLPLDAKSAAIAISTTATTPGMKLARPRRIGTPSARIQAGDTNAWTGPRTEATSGHPHLYRCEKSSERRP